MCESIHFHNTSSTITSSAELYSNLCSAHALQAPSGVLLPGLELPYAAPFVPPPSLPPPEHVGAWGDGEGGGSHRGNPWRPARRRALLVGANYARSGERGAALRGCVRDAHCLHALLSARFGCARGSFACAGPRGGERRRSGGWPLLGMHGQYADDWVGSVCPIGRCMWHACLVFTMQQCFTASYSHAAEESRKAYCFTFNAGSSRRT